MKALSGFALLAVAFDATLTEGSAAEGVSGAVYALPVLAPDYIGSDDYRVLPFAGVNLALDGYFLRTEGAGVVANASPFPYFIAGPALNYRIGRDNEAIESAAVQALGEIDGAWEVGGFAGFAADGVLKPGDRLEIYGKALFDVSDVHEGRTVQMIASYIAPLSDRFSGGIILSAAHGDEKYIDAYFGIDAAQSVASGLDPYAAEEGFQDAGVTLTGQYMLSDRWGVFGIAGYSHLLGSAQKSPIVEVEGDANQFFGGVGLLFAF